MFKGGSVGGLIPITTQPTMSQVTTPPSLELIHREKTGTPIVPLEIATESSARPIGTGPTAAIGGGSSE